MICFKDFVINIFIIISVGVVIWFVMMFNNGEKNNLRMNSVLVIIVFILEWLLIVILVEDLI